MSLNSRCAECDCSPQTCINEVPNDCTNCTKQDCCCLTVHKTNEHPVKIFFHHTRTLFAAALGIEILCISAAEIGENSAFYFYGYHIQGIVFGYVAGYGLAAFTTFMTILGRYDIKNAKIDSCCSVLEQQSNRGFIRNLFMTFQNFGVGIFRLFSIHNHPDIKYILKTSLVILVTAETACILTAETVDLIFYKQSMLLSIPLALLAGAFAVVAPGAYKKMKNNSLSSCGGVSC
jgi:hypothetical protein